MIYRLILFLRATYKNASIQTMVYVSFTLSTTVVVLLIGISLYNRFSWQLDRNMQDEKQILIDQVNQTLDSHLRSMMKVSDSLYYSVIKNKDLEGISIREDMQLIYDVNKDHIPNIALFDLEGRLIESAPPAKQKGNVEIGETNWFQVALKKPENLHFAIPTIQNVFADTEYQWVIPLSRAVEITRNKNTEQGILLIDMKYNSIEQIFKNAKLANNGYIYLVDSIGEIIYHPKRQLIASGVFLENQKMGAIYRDGNYEEEFEGEMRRVTVKSVGYTGWKIIGVTKEHNLALNNVQNRIFLLFLFFLFVFILSIMNSYISSKITNPIKELEKSMLTIEYEMDEGKIYIGGSYEVQHLSKTIKKMVKQMRRLMENMVQEQESKRKAELDALQAQINPHFLYNTLDIIVWMVENERPGEAVKVVTALARLFRISLSRGRTIISVEDELEHIRNYLTIQEMRFKNKFTYEINVDPALLNLATIKLLVQPIVENAIYHGMEFMDGDGMVVITVYREKDELYIEVADNGFGMRPEVIETLLSRRTVGSESGSGIGLWNIQERIRIYFGQSYGLIIESELDEGSKIKIHLPAISYEAAREQEGGQ